MNITDFQALLTPAGQQVLQTALELEPREVDFLRHFQKLSRSFPRHLSRAALETAILRREAKDKFPFAEKLYFTRQALEQATPYEVSAYRAERYRIFDYLADLACSIGSDTFTMAALAPTVGIDVNPLRLAMAKNNLKSLNLTAETVFLEADLLSPLPLSPSSSKLALFFDPARRTSRGRVFSVENYLPPLPVILDWLPRFPALGVKISPGVKMDELRGYEAEVEFISLNGDLKEAVLWFGPMQTTIRRATVLPGPHTLTPIDGMLSQRWSDPYEQQVIPLTEPQNYLYEPDPAVIRAGLVEDLGVQLDAAQLDPDIAYLTAEDLMPTPFARVWVVEDWFPFQLKRLRAYLRERNVGQVVVKKRGSPIQPEDLVRSLRLEGAEKRVVFLTHLRGRPIVIVCSS